MILNNSIKIKNYKCFGEEEQGFDKIYPINIIIGKNNSGKSSLIDLISYVINNDQTIDIGRNNAKAKVLVSDIIKKEQIGSFSTGGITHSHAMARQSPTQYHLDLIGEKYTYTFIDRKAVLINPEQFKNQLENIVNKIKRPFDGKEFRRIFAERDMLPDNSGSMINISSNGTGATNAIREIYMNSKHNIFLVKDDLLNAINKIVEPDISFTQLIPRSNSDDQWEIYFEYPNKSLVALSKMGSGIKTILLVLINLLIIPSIHNRKKEDLVFGFEELENNLHPSLQRRLFNYIAEYAEANKAYFFITTHSSIVIDLFSSNLNAQILHLENINSTSTVTKVETHFEGRNVLKDLDYKASDLLLSNGIIWVEGPSDAIYIELLLELYQKYLNINFSNLSFTIQTLATAIWKYAGFKNFDWGLIDEAKQNHIISLQKINHNHLLIIDNDGNYEDKKPSEWDTFSNGTGKNKAKLIYESIKFANQNENELENNYGDTKGQKLLFWINDGTFETYLEHFINNKGKTQFASFFQKHKKLKYFEKKREGEDSAISKVELASNIANFILENNLTIEDLALKDSPLFNKIKRLFETIQSWNGIEK